MTFSHEPYWSVPDESVFGGGGSTGHNWYNVGSAAWPRGADSRTQALRE